MEPAWLRVAKAYLGTKTLPGRCAAFVGGCLELSGYPSTLSIKARSYLEYGRETRLRLGCIVVLWRREVSSTLGHTGFYIFQKDERVYLLGSHNGLVSIKSFSKHRIIGKRWPLTNLDSKPFIQT